MEDLTKSWWPCTDEDIAAEAEACRAAFKAAPNATWAWCCHHWLRCEPLTQPADRRIAYILAGKPKAECVARLINFRPVLSPLPSAIIEAEADYRKSVRAVWRSMSVQKALKARDKAWADHGAEVAEAHGRDVPGNTWNGTDIFL